MTSVVKPLTWTLGVLLSVLGLLGFVVRLPILQVDSIFAIILLISGLIYVWAIVMDEEYARISLIALGFFFLLVVVAALLRRGNIITRLNTVDEILCGLVAVAGLVVGFMTPRIARKEISMSSQPAFPKPLSTPPATPIQTSQPVTLSTPPVPPQTAPEAPTTPSTPPSSPVA